MVIDKKLNLDKQLEYCKDGDLIFSQNIVVSDDGLTIQNEPAIVNFCNIEGIDYAGFVACNEEFVIFTKDSRIIRVNKSGVQNKVDTNWKWCGGEVFGTFTYNVNNELIVAISERNSNNDCPLKIINLSKDYVDGYDKDDIYTLTPNIPKSNVIDVGYVGGNKIKKGKYDFFIKYFIDNTFETGWFPIGVPVFAYDNSKSTQSKIIDSERIQAVGELNSTGVPQNAYDYSVEYVDFYNNNDEYTNDNIVLTVEVKDTLIYTHYQIGYIINTQSSTEGRKTYKYKITDEHVVINDISEPESVDNLTIGTFNIYNVNTMCNYKNRLYLANYKEENVNIKVKSKIDTSEIKIYYDINESNDYRIVVNRDSSRASRPSTDSANRERRVDDYSKLKDQWKSRPGKGAVYNFFIHYVYPNGSYTDGFHIGNILDHEEEFEYGMWWVVNSELWEAGLSTIIITNDTTTDDIYNKIVESETYYSDKPDYTFLVKVGLKDFLTSHTGQKWFDVRDNFVDTGYPSESRTEDIPEVTDKLLVTLNNYVNSNGELLYTTPINKKFDASKLYFTGIKMYPEFVGYFISYEEPEYIQIGEGILTTYEKGLFNANSVMEDDNMKFYYPEFNIVGGNVDIDRIVKTGIHNNIIIDIDPRLSSYDDSSRPSHNKYLYGGATGMLLPVKNNLDESEYPQELVVKDKYIVSPNDFSNIGKEGFLNLTFHNDVTINNETNVINTYTAYSDNLNLYLSKNKKLVSLGYVKYMPSKEASDCTYGYENVPYNYDFYKCFSSIIFFSEDGVIVNSATSNPINASDGTEFYIATNNDDVANTVAHIGIIKYWHESHYPLFLKKINQGGEVIFHSYYTKIKEYVGPDETTEEGRYMRLVDRQTQIRNLVISPAYVNDLYKLDAATYSYTGKFITNYDDTLYQNELEQYNKTIRRSDVIQSESVVNSWKYFRPENYKIITENKGDIKNVIGIGNYLFAHCEHSLFLFDITDSLQTLDKNVQLLQPDSFDVNYKEVFTTDKGYAGIQDYVSWICDEFGYIFYDASSKNIYRFDGGQLKDISEGISNFIKYFNPEHIWMGNDRERNRILFNFRGIDDSVIFSYNFIADGWSSTHSYISNYKFIGLKDKLFIPNVVGNSLTITHYLDTEFNKFSLPVGNIDNDGSYKSFIDVVFTSPNYNKIKVLDFITYVLNKNLDSCFELLTLEIYTNCCYSGIIDISQDRTSIKEYNKPYYDYGRWNFNWFRNIVKYIQNPPLVNRLTGHINHSTYIIDKKIDNALMTGKYVIIRFNFKSTLKQVNIKDIHAYFKL